MFTIQTLSCVKKYARLLTFNHKLVVHFLETFFSIWGAVWPYLLAIFLFGVLIGIHEFGHFSFAKLFKVRVNEFSIGMGPKIISKKKGDTAYSLRLFPIGGFVSMEGEDEDSDDENAFNKKTVWQRFIIIAAGAVLNLILGVIVVAICLGFSDLVGSTTVADFPETAVSDDYGLKVNDKILEINGTNIYSYRGISFNLLRDEDNKVDVLVKRDGEKLLLEDVQFGLTNVNGKNYVSQDFILYGYKPTVLNILGTAVGESASIVQMVWLSLVDLVSMKYGLEDISGPIGTVSAVAESTTTQVTFQDKILTALNFLSMITINVGIVNLIPFPALDGGRLLLLIVEKIRRKPLPAKVEAGINTVGLAVLLGFMAIVTFSDILKFFK